MTAETKGGISDDSGKFTLFGVQSDGRISNRSRFIQSSAKPVKPRPTLDSNRTRFFTESSSTSEGDLAPDQPYKRTLAALAAFTEGGPSSIICSVEVSAESWVPANKIEIRGDSGLQNSHPSLKKTICAPVSATSMSSRVMMSA